MLSLSSSPQHLHSGVRAVSKCRIVSFKIRKMRKTMPYAFQSFSLGSVKLLPSIFQQRFDLNRRYMLSLRNENLLQNFYLEAGLWGPRRQPQDCHWGWESPTCQLRGHFLGHWLSGAARIYAATGDALRKLEVRLAGMGICLSRARIFDMILRAKYRSDMLTGKSGLKMET